MRITLTLLRASGEPADLTVTVEPSVTVADLARYLDGADPARIDAPGTHLTLQLHGRPGSSEHRSRTLAPEAPAVDSLRPGSVVSLTPADGPPDQPAADAPDHRAAATPSARVRVLTGPDAGLVVDLPEGSHVIGRADGCRVRLTDPAASREHARLTVGLDVHITDLGSANGVLRDGRPVHRHRLQTSDTVTVGTSTLRLERLDLPGRGEVLEHGPVPFNRSPRLAPAFPAGEVEAPGPPEPPRPARLPVVMLAVPLVLAPLLLWSGRGALSLLFLAMMPLMLLGSYVDQRVTHRRTHRAAVEQFTRNLAAVRQELADRRTHEARQRRAEHPSVGELVHAALALEPLLWSRRPEHAAFGELRLGVGAVPSRTQVRLPARGRTEARYWDQLTGLAADFRDVAQVPVTARLRECGALGLAGPPEVRHRVARGLVTQLALLHSPAELVLTVATAPAGAARWQWTTWLPHVGSAHSPLTGPHTGCDPSGVHRLVSRLEGLVADRGRQNLTLPLVVLLVEDDAPVDRARLVRLAEDGPRVGVHLLWCAAAVAALPAACRAFLRVGADPGSAAVRGGDEGAEPVTGEAGFVDGGPSRPLGCEALDEFGALTVARHLAGVRDAGAPPPEHTALPVRVPFLTLVGPDLATPEGVLRRWAQTGAQAPGEDRRAQDLTLGARVGSRAGRPVTLDLRAQGPHALVGGTTGAGKSEFLQAWILAMATAHGPDRVTFLLVDYKGGAAFGDCRALPHTVGLVTDLSPHLVRRALTSLRAEVRHRERLLNRKQAKDLLTLERAGDPEAPPSLVVVVDEFAALAAEVPQFVDGVVDVAQRGRSLGLHLVLATQRPAGVITEHLRANTNLRIGLRMADEVDSVDVLGSPVAARFPPDLPGRAVVRTGPGELVSFQAGYAGGRTTGVTAPPITVETLSLGDPVRWEPARSPVLGEGPTDVARVVTAVRDAATRAGLPAPRRPWLPTLEPVVDLAALGRSTDSAVVLGLVDDPAHQHRFTAVHRPDSDGHIGFYGAGGSGKSTALRTVALGAASGEPVHVYALDFSSGGLAALEVLPHVGAVIDGDDVERVHRVLRHLTREVAERSARYAAARASTLQEYRRASRRPEPRLVLLLDGFGAFRAEWEVPAAGRGEAYRMFLALLADGRAAGVHVALTADRPGAVPATVAGHLAQKVVLRQVDHSAYSVLGVPADVLAPTSPPGRALTTGGLEMQVAVPGGSAHHADQVRALESAAADLRRAGVPEAPAVRRLPDLVEPEALPDRVGGLPVLGLADDTLEPVGFEPAGTFLLAGPPRSGRTGGVRWLVESIARAEPATWFVHLSARRSPLQRSARWRYQATGWEEVAEKAREVAGLLSDHPGAGQARAVVVVEDVADFLSTPAEGPLTDLVRRTRRTANLVIAEGETGSWGSAWPLLSEVRSGRRGLALQPESMDGEVLFRTAFPRGSRAEFPPGRGLVVDRATVRKVQLPLVPADPG